MHLFDDLIALMAATIWLIHIVALVRAKGPGRTAPLLVAAVGLGATAVVHQLARHVAAEVSFGVLAWLLLVPGWLTRAASRALRTGRPRRAELYARLAVVLRPLPGQRMALRSMRLSRRFAMRETEDVDAAVEALGLRSEGERQAYRLAFLSWTDRFDEMVEMLEDPRLRRLALVHPNLAGAVVVAVGETQGEVPLLRLVADLLAAPWMRRRGIEVGWGLAVLAAYAGAVDVVRRAARAYAGQLSLGRIAFVVATAEQRVGDVAAAEQTLRRALVSERLPANRARLEFRLAHPLVPATDMLADARTRIARRLRSRMVLASLGLDLAAPAPVTRGLALLVAAAFAYQLQAEPGPLLDAWAVEAPYRGEVAEPVRLLSYSLLHLNGWHLGFNLVGLLLFGRFVERELGRVAALLIYLGGVLGGGLAFLAVSDVVGQQAIGASGGVMGLFGATVARIGLDPELRRPGAGRRELIGLGIVAAGQLAIDAFFAQSSGSAHAGGLVAGGLIAAIVMIGRRTKN